MYMGKDKPNSQVISPENPNFEPISLRIPLETENELTEPGYTEIKSNDNKGFQMI